MWPRTLTRDIAIITAILNFTECAIQDLDDLPPDQILQEINPSDDKYFKYDMLNEIPESPEEFAIGAENPDMDQGENPIRMFHINLFHLDRYPVSIIKFKEFLQSKKKYRPTAIRKGFSYVVKGFEKKTGDEQFEAHPNETTYVKVASASWRLPEGKGSSIRDTILNPVTHVSYDDANAYCLWKKKRLPTEVEWEYAARGAKKGLKYPWGQGWVEGRANVWEGRFTNQKKAQKDGYIGLAPVDAFPPQNDLGVYDMLGNAWEWTSTVYREKGRPMKDLSLRYTLRGASFIDSRIGGANHSARITARKAAARDFTAQNVGFRCALSDDEAQKMSIKRLPEHTEL